MKKKMKSTTQKPKIKNKPIPSTNGGSQVPDDSVFNRLTPTPGFPNDPDNAYNSAYFPKYRW